MLPRPGVVAILLTAAAAWTSPVAADTVRDGRVVLLTSASQGAGDSVCQASPFNQKACDKAQKQYDKDVSAITKKFDSDRKSLEKKRDADLKKAKNEAAKQKIRDKFAADLAKLQDKREKDLDKAQASL